MCDSISPSIFLPRNYNEGAMKLYYFNRKTALPKDIFFHVDREKVHSYDDDEEEPQEGEVFVVMCPIEFFNSRGCVYDQHLGIHDLIPEFMGECAECLFESNYPVDLTREKLLELGFVENEKFSNFCKNHDPFV